MRSAKKTSKWTRPPPLKRPDYITSSIFSERGEMGFLPSYDHGRPNLIFLLTNEYMRMWFKEREQHEKDTYKPVFEESYWVQRRFVQRNIENVKKQKLMPIIRMRKFSDVPGKIDTKKKPPKPKLSIFSKLVAKAEEEKKKQFIKFKPDCKSNMDKVKLSKSSEKCCEINKT